MTMLDLGGCYRPQGFQRLRSILNMATGEMVDVDIEIHADDADWLVWSWQELFLLDWKIGAAEALKSGDVCGG